MRVGASARPITPPTDTELPARRPHQMTARIAGWLLASAVLAVGWSPVAPAPALASPQDATLQRTLTHVLDDSRTTRAKTAAMVLDGSDGTLLFSERGTGSRMPASNTKIVTAVAAMDTLGPSYRFRTEVIRRAAVRKGVLKGNLYIKGYGDPTTRLSDLQSLAAAVRNAGITRITGRLVVDASYFDSQRYNPYWSKGYADDYYAAETAALTLAPNADLDSGTVIVRYTAGERGKKATITTTPASARTFLTFRNSTTTTARGTRSTASITRSYGSATIRVHGRVPLGRSGSRLITVKSPHLYAARIFRAELTRLDVGVAGGTISRSVPAGKRTVLATDRSMELRDLLRPFLKYSNNMHAEALTKAMGVRVSGSGSWAAGIAATRRYLADLGVPLEGVRLRDGSGLSRSDRLTPVALTRTLFAVQQASWFDDFYLALPVAGVASRPVGGTLRYRMNSTRAEGNAHAKTGSLTGVTALSGYVTGRDGRPYVFSLLSNYSGSTPRPVENSFVVALANRSR